MSCRRHSLLAVPGPPGPGDVLHLGEERTEGLHQLLFLRRHDLKGKQTRVTLQPEHTLPRRRRALLERTRCPPRCLVPPNGAGFGNRVVASVIS